VFTQPLDIANRACQHVGARLITALPGTTRQGAQINACYDGLRRAELRRSPWRFATRRAMLRVITATSLRFIPAAYDSGTTYDAGQIVQDTSGIYWISTVGGNLGNTPGAAVTGQPPYWQQYFGAIVADEWADQTGLNPYQAGDLVYTAGPVFYLNTANNQTDADPANGAPWVAMPGSPTSQAIALLDPAGPGLTLDNTGGSPPSIARNLFALPNGYLRPLPPDPKVAATSTLTTSAALRFLYFQLEGNWIISGQGAPILFRFIADVSDVTAMDDLFCEALGARVGYEICETITQSPAKLQAIGAAYQKFMADARTISWIETGSTEPQEEEYALGGVTPAAPQPQAQGR
jgi:hypothetical protein